MRRQFDKVPERVFERIVEAQTAAETEKAVLRDLWYRREEYAKSPAEIYASHLRLIISTCRSAGAEVVLCTYPDMSPFEAVNNRLSHELEVDVVPVNGAFKRRLEAEPSLDLFVEDGHCNDEGYRLMADTVTTDALRRLR